MRLFMILFTSLILNACAQNGAEDARRPPLLFNDELNGVSMLISEKEIAILDINTALSKFESASDNYKHINNSSFFEKNKYCITSSGLALLADNNFSVGQKAKCGNFTISVDNCILSYSLNGATKCQRFFVSVYCDDLTEVCNDRGVIKLKNSSKAKILSYILDEREGIIFIQTNNVDGKVINSFTRVRTEKTVN